MLKQYRVEGRCMGKYCVYLYHDGELILEKEMWDDEGFDEWLAKLEEDDYKECYTPREVREARRVYEKLRKNVIGGEEKFKDMER